MSRDIFFDQPDPRPLLLRRPDRPVAERVSPRSSTRVTSAPRIPIYPKPAWPAATATTAAPVIEQVRALS